MPFDLGDIFTGGGFRAVLRIKGKGPKIQANQMTPMSILPSMPKSD